MATLIRSWACVGIRQPGPHQSNEDHPLDTMLLTYAIQPLKKRATGDPPAFPDNGWLPNGSDWCSGGLVRPRRGQAEQPEVSPAPGMAGGPPEAHLLSDWMVQVRRSPSPTNRLHPLN